MSWVTAFQKFGHRIFIAYIELKIEGNWEKVVESYGGDIVIHHEILTAKRTEGCFVHIIEPDGLRRIIQFTDGGTIALHQNILSYHPDQIVESHEVDEKAQAGKGKTRDIIS